jgi:transcriptional regulator with XRE-family HTH domain
MNFAEMLRHLREKAGITQAALAEAAQVPLGTLRDYEQGIRRNDPSLGTAVKLAAALGVSVEVFADCVRPEGATQGGKRNPGREPTTEPEQRGKGRPAKREEPAPVSRRGKGRPRKGGE